MPQDRRERVVAAGVVQRDEERAFVGAEAGGDPLVDDQVAQQQHAHVPGEEPRLGGRERPHVTQAEIALARRQASGGGRADLLEVVDMELAPMAGQMRGRP